VAGADLLLMSSRHEAGPFALLEAAIAGVPTVGTAVGHLIEWAPVATRTAPPGDAERLADAIGEVLADEELRLRLAWAAQRRAMQEDADHTARAFEALYLSMGAIGHEHRSALWPR
jgi:glycosyltransferase involved in cell wall biosynthesis